MMVRNDPDGEVEVYLPGHGTVTLWLDLGVFDKIETLSCRRRGMFLGILDLISTMSIGTLAIIIEQGIENSGHQSCRRKLNQGQIKKSLGRERGAFSKAWLAVSAAVIALHQDPEDEDAVPPGEAEPGEG